MPSKQGLLCLALIAIIMVCKAQADGCGGGRKCVEGIYGYVQAFRDGFCEEFNQCSGPAAEIARRYDYPGCVCKPNSYRKSTPDHYFTQSTDGSNYVSGYDPYSFLTESFTFRDGPQIHSFDVDTVNTPNVEARLNFGLERDAIIAWVDVMRDLGRQMPSLLSTKKVKGSSADQLDDSAEIVGPYLTIVFTFQVEFSGIYDIYLADDTCPQGPPSSPDNLPCTLPSASRFKIERVGYQVEPKVPILGKPEGNSRFDNYLYGKFRESPRGYVELKTGEGYRMELTMRPQGIMGDQPVRFSMMPRK